MPQESKVLSGISNIERQRDAAGSRRNNAPFGSPLSPTEVTQYKTSTGIVACNPIIFDVQGSDFVKSDNIEIDKNSKSNSYKVIYYYSPEKSQEIQPPSEDLLALPDSEPRYKLFLANLAQGIGGGRIIVDSSKEKSLPSRGDKIVFQSIVGDHAYPSKIVSIEQTTSKEIGVYNQAPSLKEQAIGGTKLQKSNQIQDQEVPGSEKDVPFVPDISKYFNGKIPWVEVPTDIPGRNTVPLRQDAAEAYKKIYSEIKNIGEKMLVSGAGRDLQKVAGVGASKKSMHYIGRAFDLGRNYGMQDPAKDPYIVTKDENGRWTVWQKTNNKKYPIVTLSAVVYIKQPSGASQLREVKISTRAFNFTEIAKQYGFTRIPGFDFFYKGGAYEGAEWWHFQYKNGLITNQSVYGQELLAVYSEAQAKSFIYWNESKDLVWTGNGFNGYPKKQKT
jgi:hypothetical protein